MNTSRESATGLRGDEAELFKEHSQALFRAVMAAVHTSRANIEDACAFAWTQLLGTQPERRDELFAWLRTTAVREAIRLDQADRRRNPTDEFPELAMTERFDDEARAALEEVGGLPPRIRRVFALHIAGYSYEEIGNVTGYTGTTVARLMARARVTVRR